MSPECPSAPAKPSSSFLVVSPAAPWAEWTNHSLAVVGQISTRLDDPDYPFGQWTGRVRWIHATGTDVVLGLDFLVAELELPPGTKLGFFLGKRHVADLVVRDPSTPIVDIEPTRTVRLRGALSFAPAAHEASAVAALTQSLVEAEDERILDAMEPRASESNADGVSPGDPGVD